MNTICCLFCLESINLKLLCLILQDIRRKKDTLRLNLIHYQGVRLCFFSSKNFLSTGIMLNS